MLESCHTHSNNKKKLNVKSTTLLRWTTELRSQDQPSPQALESEVNTENHNLLGAEAIGRNNKMVTDEFLEVECKFA